MESNMNFDNEVLAYLSTRKVELMQQHDEYITEHPEIREVLNDFLSSVLLHKPVSVQRSLKGEQSVLGRRFCLRERVLPSLQPDTAQE